MTKHTVTALIIAGLTDAGFIEIPSKSKKYRTFKWQESEQLRFVGKSGSLRIGATSSESYAVTEDVKAYVIRRGRRALLAQQPILSDVDKAQIRNEAEERKRHG